jgi:hypothetical protein
MRPHLAALLGGAVTLYADFPRNLGSISRANLAPKTAGDPKDVLKYYKIICRQNKFF